MVFHIAHRYPGPPNAGQAGPDRGDDVFGQSFREGWVLIPLTFNREDYGLVLCGPTTVVTSTYPGAPGQIARLPCWVRDPFGLLATELRLE